MVDYVFLEHLKLNKVHILNLIPVAGVFSTILGEAGWREFVQLM